jgi:putative tryptophan/tyrosine transport system substrate-binding protein
MGGSGREVPVLRGLIVLFIALCYALPTVAEAYQVLVLVSSRAKIYDRAVSGLRRGKDFSERVVYLQDYAEVDLARTIREERPQVIVAVGDLALAEVRNIRRIPLVSLMSLSFLRLAGSSPTLTGVEPVVSPERCLALLNALELDRVGVLYDPDKTGGYLKKAQQLAARSDIVLVPRVVKSPKEVLGQLTRLPREVDALWMIPDATAVNQVSAEAFFLYSLRRQIPVVSFNRDHLRFGAAAVIEADQVEMGRQAAEMVSEILSGTPVSKLPVMVPRKVQIKVNTSVLKNLHLPAEKIERLTNLSGE